MDCPCLIRIIETLQARCEALSALLGQARAVRLARHLARGCRPIGDVMWAWALSIAMESTNDPDTLVAVHILLTLFAAEARALQTDVYGVIQEFWRRWADRCIRRLMRGMVMGDLVFRGSKECVSPKWGGRIQGGRFTLYLE